MFDSSLGARFANPKIEGPFGADTMPQTADNLARDFQLSREDCDAFALGSQQKYAKAKAEGFFKDEIQAVTIAGTRGKPDTVVAEDEHPRADTTPETLKKLKALFEGGVTTAGNASGINDGAVALMVASRDAGDKAGQSRSRASSRRAWPVLRRAPWVLARCRPRRRRWSAPGSS